MDNNPHQNYQGFANTINTIFETRFDRPPVWVDMNPRRDDGPIARRPRTREEEEIERRILNSTAPLRRHNDRQGNISPLEIGQMLQHVQDLLRQFKDENNRKELPPRCQLGRQEDVDRLGHSEQDMKIHNTLLKLKNFTGVEAEKKPFDKHAAMVHLYEAEAAIYRAQEIAKKYAHALPLVDTFLANLYDALEDLADAINPPEELIPIPIEKMPEDLTVQFVSHRQNAMRSIIMSVWTGAKELLLKLVRELKPQEEALMKLLPSAECIFQKPSNESKCALPFFNPKHVEDKTDRNWDGTGPSTSN